VFSWWPAAAWRLPFFALLWWALAEGDLSRWQVGLAAAGLATYASLALLPPPTWRLRWGALPGFLGFFFVQAFFGGVDVSRRALHPRLPIKPNFLCYQLELRPLAARLLMAWVVSLLPGTLSVELEDHQLEVHVLDQSLPNEWLLARLEERIAALFV